MSRGNENEGRPIKSSRFLLALVLVSAWMHSDLPRFFGLPSAVSEARAAILEASATAATTTTSTTDVVMTGMTLTPGAGDYLVVFSTSVKSAAAANIFVSIYVSQASATADTPLTSATYTLLGGMTLSPAAGTYGALFSTSADGVSGSIIDTALFVGGVQVAHTERSMTQEASIPSTEFAHAILAKVTPTAGQAVEVRWKNSGTAGVITAHQRTLTLYKVDPANIFEAPD